jgi:hypothetical protein
MNVVASVPNATVTRVDFYRNGNLLGSDEPLAPTSASLDCSAGMLPSTRPHFWEDPCPIWGNVPGMAPG